jgi:hypothetical protein
LEVALIIGVVIIVALAAGVFVMAGSQRKPGRSAGAQGIGSPDAAGSPTRARPKLGEFHVKGEDALVYFEVPLPPGGAEEVLRDLLVREAVEVVHEKKSHDLPMDQLLRVRAFARSSGAWAEVGALELDQPGKLPRRDAMPDIVPHASATGFDPLADVAQRDFKMAAGVADVSTEKGLAPIGKELRLSGAIDAMLRSQGVDPDAMSAVDLTMALLQVGGYAVSPVGDGTDTYVATRAGAQTYLRVVAHEPGAYPELDESAITSFLIGFGQNPAGRGLLISDKFGPFVMYDKERREPRVKFITRERLQAFVDSFVAG